MAPVTHYDQLDERELVELARRDPNAFAELYRRYVDRIYSYAYRRCASPPLAQDVTSSTFEKALRGLGSYRWSEPGIGPWLFRIASNELVDAHRRSGRQQRISSRVAQSLRTNASTQRDAAERHDDRDEILIAMSNLRPRYQRALGLRYFADLTNEEAAAAMHLSRATMAVLVHRASVALRREVENGRRAEVPSHD